MNTTEKALAPTATAATEAPTFVPDIDLLQGEDGFTLILDLPGVCADGVEIGYDDGTLTIVGRRHLESESDHPISTEYAIGDFERKFRLSERIDSARIEATLTDGVLTVDLPIAQSAQPRRIPIR